MAQVQMRMSSGNVSGNAATGAATSSAAQQAGGGKGSAGVGGLMGGGGGGQQQQSSTSAPSPDKQQHNVGGAAAAGATSNGLLSIAVGSILSNLSEGGAASEGISPPSPSSGSPTGQDTFNAATTNTKEKTPMCLINELARFNKIQHQYRLTDESGPAHKKTFTVLLKLGEEEYDASGLSIKKAQHSAAGRALEKTEYKHPPPKPKTSVATKLMDNITPTVELNALAMKRGEPAVYSILEQSRMGPFPMPQSMNYRGAYHQRYHYPRYPRPCYVSLRVGNRAFIGEGLTMQSARHNAAEKALRALRDLPLPEPNDKRRAAATSATGGSSATSTDEATGKAGSDESTAAGAASAASQNGTSGGGSGGVNNDDELDDDDDESELKSPISLVHEIALKRNLRVDFEVIRESGPPHMRNFVTKCVVGTLSTEGDGNGKKLSKKRAAQKMLDELKKLPPLSPTIFKVKKKPNTVKKKSRNLIKANPDYGQGINPISRLIQIQQAKKEKEPVYVLLDESGMPCRREFVMQVQVGSNACTGTGPNKKLAKRSAAEGLLQVLGYSRPPPLPTPRPAIKREPEVEAEKRKVTFLEHESLAADKVDGEGRSGRQLVPGLLLMPDSLMGGGADANHGMQNFQQHHLLSGPAVGMGRLSTGHFASQDLAIAAIAKELLDHGSSATAEAILKSGQKLVTGQSVIRPKQQLTYLADVLGFSVQFTDFPRGNKREYLSLVSLSTNPPQVSHGAGETLEASHDQAALTALQSLTELGIDSSVAKIKLDSAFSSSCWAGPSKWMAAALSNT